MEAAEPVITIADKITDLLTSDAHGNRLLTCLLDLIRTASRFDVAIGVSVAFQILEADRVGLIGDLNAAEREIAALERELAKRG